VWDLRLPRALLAALLGGVLGVSGALTQGLFRNPMAEPGVLGVSSGAAAMAVLGFYLGFDQVSLWAIPLMAVVGAAGILVLLFALAGRSSVATLLLSGIALGAFCSAFVTMALATQDARWDIGIKVMQWLLGSFEGRSWAHLAGALPPCIVGLLLARWVRNDLDALHLGDETAASLGVDLKRTRTLCIIAVAILVGTATAIPGVIAFVGLIVPHVVRMIIGPSHRALLPGSMALGALTLVLVDTVSRTLLPSTPPPGVITSLLGAPFFLWLLQRRPRSLQ
jgi:iron complex transport system permease protein